MTGLLYVCAQNIEFRLWMRLVGKESPMNFGEPTEEAGGRMET